MTEEITEKYGEMPKEMLISLKKAIIEKDLEYWKSRQVNFSSEAEMVFEKVKEGKKLTELDVFILCCDNPKQLEEYRKFYTIRETIKEGKINRGDLHFLIDTLCGKDEQTANQMKQKFEFLVRGTETEK